jgi:hypothetical protein
MKARAWTTGVAILALLCVSVPPARAALGTVAAALREEMENNVAAYDRGDVDGTMRTIDTRSPDYAPTQKAVAQQVKDLGAKAELVDFTYMGHDDEFAVARAKVKTTGKPGTGFTDNTVDALLTFHQENGAWKLWSEQILGVQVAK